MDLKNAIQVFFAIGVLVLVLKGGFDLGASSVWDKIHDYGCEKVVAVHNEHKKK